MSLADLDRRVHMAIAGFIAVLFFVLMALAIIATPGLDGEAVGGAEDFGRIADIAFDTHVLALEALGILLTAAMIGAMVIARPLGSQPDSVNYAGRVDAKKLAVTQSVSNVERNLRDGGFVTPTYIDINAGNLAASQDTGGEEE